MRVCSVREKKYRDALIYRALDIFYEIGTIFFLKESNLLYQWEYKSREYDSENLASHVTNRFYGPRETSEDYDNLF